MMLVGTAALWLSLALLAFGALLLVALLVWRYQIAARQARRRRPGRSLFSYLDRR